MIKKIEIFFILILFCIPVYAAKRVTKLKVYPNPWIPESGKSYNASIGTKGDEMRHGAYTADGWIKFEGVATGKEDSSGNIPPEYSGTLRVYDITGHLIRFKRWTIEEESKIPLPKTSGEWKKPDPEPWPQPENYTRNKHIVHWDGKNNNNEYVESGVYIWIIEEEDGSKYDGKVVVIR